MAELKISDNHNVVVFLMDPPVVHRYFKSMIPGLNKCCLAYAFTSSPIIYQVLVKQFWNTIVVCKEDDDAISVEAADNGRKITVTEQVIDEVLQINDRSYNRSIMDSTHNKLSLYLYLGFESYLIWHCSE